MKNLSQSAKLEVSDELLQHWYSNLTIALKALNQVPSMTDDYQHFYPHGEALLEAKAYLNQAVSTQMAELRRRDLPYGLNEIGGAIDASASKPYESKSALRSSTEPRS